MDKEKAIDICNRYYQDRLNSFEEIFSVVAEYALSKGKTQEQIVLLAKVLAINPIELSNCFKHVVDYYRREYSLTSVHIIKDNQLLNPILIY